MERKHFLQLLLFTLSIWGMSSCEQDLGNPQAQDARQAPLSIDAVLSGCVETRAEKNVWTRGDALGIFLCKPEGKTGTPYLGKESYSNVPYIYNGSFWETARETNLGIDAASVYAYYPYIDQADPEAIPVELEGQTDYLYGQSDSLVNYLEKVATIRMKHAMSQFTLQLTLGEYDGEGLVSSVRLKNAGTGAHLVDGGLLNIESGHIVSGKPKDLTLLAGDTVSIKGSKLTLSYILVPTGRTASEGDIRLEIVIDGKVFFYDFQAGTEWKAGYRNIYRSTMNSNALVIDPVNGVLIEPWKENSENPHIELIPES